MLRFLHLSDLHIGQARTKSKKSTYELCHADFLNDCRDWLAPRSDKKVDAVILTGDIAFAGADSDYLEAEVLIGEICAEIKCDRVFVVPGNHDVDRRLINLPELRRQQSLREARSTDLDEAMYQFLFQTNELYDPLKKLQNYNEFMRKNKFIGRIESSSDVHWFEDLTLENNWKIRIHGFCSVLVSNDEDTQGNMVMGSQQWYCSELAKANRDHVVLSHHPFDWLKDEQSAKTSLMARMRLFLCGHTHSAGLDTINDVACIRAGALNPGTEEEVPYSYNWIELNATEGPKPLKIEYYPRKWNPSNLINKFCPDGSNSRFNHTSHSVIEWLPSSFRAAESGEADSKQPPSQAQAILQNTELAIEAKLLLLRPLLFKALRERVSKEEIGTKGSFAQLLRHIRSTGQLREAKVDLIHECMQTLAKVNRGEQIAQMEMQWALSRTISMIGELNDLK